MAHKTPGQAACGRSAAYGATLYYPEFCVVEQVLGRPWAGLSHGL